MLKDEFAIACLVSIELETGLVRHQGLKQRLAFDTREVRDIPVGKMQDIESVIDDLSAALAIARRCVWAKLGNPASSTPQSSPSR